MTELSPVVRERKLTPALTFMLAMISGLAVASLYYCQPLLGLLMSEFHVGSQEVGYIPTFTQLGYALGIFLLIPLGDCYDRRKLITLKGLLLMCALAITALSPSIFYLCLTSFATGLLATLAQDIIPTAAALSDPEHRGKTIGKVLTGLLLGVLLSRVVSGFLAEWLGWQMIYFMAAALMLVMTLMLRAVLPIFEPMVTLSYRELIVSLFRLLAGSAVLRKAALSQGLLGVAFSAFWSTLAVMLYDAPFHQGSTTAGLFGIAGALGAIMAPLFGKYADQVGAEKVTRLGTASVALSFALMTLVALMDVSVPVQLAVLVLTTILFDLGVQATFVAHQSIIYKVDPSALSRLNSILVVSVFIGMSLGGFLASHGYALYGWPAVTVLATVAGVFALIVRLRSEHS
eukprot:RCo016598